MLAVFENLDDDNVDVTMISNVIRENVIIQP